jgi:hypothetical protein
MSFLTVPTNPLSLTITGDIDLLSALTVDNGDGTIYVRNGGMYVNGLSDLNQTTIDTTTGTFAAVGTGLVSFNVTNSIQLQAAGASYFQTSSSTLTISASNATTGKVTISAAGSGANSILVNATNSTDGQVSITSAGGSSSINPIKLLASDGTNGNILLQASGNFAATNPAIKLLADNTTSGQISLSSAGNTAAINAISVTATGSTGGSILLQGSGLNTSVPPVKIYASNATSGQVVIQSDGAIAGAVTLSATDATSGGIAITAVGGAVAINTQNTATGVTIATATAGIPCTIGTSTSVTTIAGNLIVQGTRTEINTEVLTITDNIIVVNSANGELGCDAGIVMRRFQTPNAGATGDVVTSISPVQEAGAFQAGSATPATLKLAAFASSTTDFYTGWWIKVTSGTGINQVRRIKSYNGTTKVATIYVTADNTVSPLFNDGLDLVAAPAAADTYRLYSWSYVSSYFDTSINKFNFVTLASEPAAVSSAGVSTNVIQQYQNINAGSITSRTKIYNNVPGSASTTTITYTLIDHGLTTTNIVRTSNSSAFTPAIPDGIYYVTVLTANTFTITVAASTVSTTASSSTLEFYNSSVIYANVIQPYNNDYPFTIAGISTVQDLVIPKTSTALFALSTSTLPQGAYLILVGDLTNTVGAFAVFAVASSGTGGSVSRLAASKGSDNQRLQATWTTGNTVEIYQSPAGSGGGNYTYRCRVSSAI